MSYYNIHRNFGLVLFLILYIATTALCSCSDDASSGVTGFNVSTTEITIDAKGGDEKVVVSTDEDWTATTSVPWLSVTPANGRGSAELTVRVDSSLVHDLRESTIRLTSSKTGSVFLKVSQFGYGKSIVSEKNNVEIEYNEAAKNRYFEVNVKSNVEFKVQVEYEDGEQGWIEPLEHSFTLDRGARPRSAKIRFDWKMNTTDKARKAKINLLPVNAEDKLDSPATITVTQKGAPKITDDRQGDSVAVILINASMNSLNDIETGENMMYWSNVTLWEARDEGLPSLEAVGRIRYVSFSLFNTDESISPLISYLKYAERISFYGNVNTMFKSIALDSDICKLKHLKHLQIAAYGLVTLPDDFAKLGATLETLDLNSNNFSDVPSIITKENFPKLKRLNLSTCRRWGCEDLRNRNSYDNGIGFYVNFNNKPKNSVRQLFLWDTLEQLALSYNYLEGELPEFTVGTDGVTAWTQADVAEWGGDTIRNMVGRPKILPKMKDLRLNLNYFTGKLPEWILYHPHLLDWTPESYIFTTQDKGITSNGSYCGFTNVPVDFEYYYKFFPGYKAKYYVEAE